MKTKILYTILFSVFIFSVKAQNESDALRYSQTYNGGTARFVSMGGAFGALGGDFSSLSYNPAGLGVYRSSEFTFTPSFKSRSISSDYNGSNGKDTRNRFYFDNLGFVLSFKPNKDVESGLVNLNLAFGYNRTNDFYANAFAKGDNTVNSMMDYFGGLTNLSNIYYNDMTSPSNPNDLYNPFSDSKAPWESILAWNTFLIDTAYGNNNYVAALNPGDGVLQRKRTSNTGSSGEFVFSLGANFSNKLYIGATLGVANVDYTTTTTYSEDAFSGNDTLFNGYRFYYSDYKQIIETTGSGYNFKIGVIYKPIEGLRLGLALHTPTYYNLEDTYSSSIYSNFDVHKKEIGFYSETPNSRYDYHLESPFKAIGSIAYTFKDLGLLSVDVEHVNYSSMRLRDGGDGADFSGANDAISAQYRNVNNIRVGGEVRIDDMFLRGGYAYYPSPYVKGSLNENSNRSVISGGIGYRTGNFFIDAAYLYSMQKEKYFFYNLSNADGSSAVNPVSTKMSEGKFLVTIGFKF